ncbi:MAG: hypothetical protein ACE5KH_06010, partial [Candidatus Geothermarchaeales archaeon]
YNLNLKLGFRVISEFVRMGGRPSEDGDPVSRRAEASELEEVWSYIRGSPVFEKAAGLYTKFWEWYTLTPHVLRRFMEAGKCVVHRPGDAVEGVMMVEQIFERQTQTCYIDGTPEAIRDLASWLLRWSMESDATDANVFAVNHEPIVSTLTSLGFEIHHGEMVVFEKRL